MPVGGADASSYLATVERYDIAGNSWSYVASLPVGIAWGKTVGYAGNYIYLCGGHDGTNYLSSVYVYNVTTNTWTTATSMPGERIGGALALYDGDKLIYIGGASGGSISDDVFIGTINPADPTIIVWATAENKFPGANRQFFPTCANELNENTITAPKPLKKGQLQEFTPFGGVYKFDAANWGSDAIIIAGGNDGSPGYWDPKVPNPCFVYYPDTDQWVGREKVPEPVVASYLGSVNDGSTWTLIVASGIDTISTSPPTGELTQLFTETLGGATSNPTLIVSDGWNMVSISGNHPTNNLVTTWWPNLIGAVYKYAGGYVVATTATPGEGYWMKHNGTQTYNYTGIFNVPNDPIPAFNGWNMFGGYENVVLASTIYAANSHMGVGTIYGYAGGYVPATQIDPCYGYWCKLTAANPIFIPPGPFAKDNSEIVEYFKDDWGRIAFTDATGTNYTLYAVKDEVDLDRYELPPLPPQGMFDIRFSSGRIAEDLNSGIQSIDLRGITYPLIVSVENINITLQDETSKRLNVELRSGENVTISSSLEKLVVLSGEFAIPEEYALYQNYPNPFNPATTIKFALPEATNVTLTIYNALGQKVGELVNSKLEAGRYSYQWYASNVASGMYIYELRTDKFVSVKKMVVMK